MNTQFTISSGSCAVLFFWKLILNEAYQSAIRID
jgi:hypothetical protein